VRSTALEGSGDAFRGSVTEQPAPLTSLSIVMPARNEDGCVAATVRKLYREMTEHAIGHEIVAVDDNSVDRTWEILQKERTNIPTLRPIRNPSPHGFGRAIVRGLNAMTGDAVVIMMADDSDDSRDVVRYWQQLQAGYDCVFGSRFIRGGRVIDYPLSKLVLNRFANGFIRVLFQHGLNDTTNAFKAY
jgi:dolichol-phosphate mannosyltransferase